MDKQKLFSNHFTRKFQFGTEKNQEQKIKSNI